VPSLTRACPILPAPDVRAAAAWYRDHLGFTIRLLVDGYGIIERDGIELHFWTCDDRRIAENTSAYVRVDGIEAFRRALPGIAGGGRISALETRSWGMCEFYVWDPSGNLLRFGERIEAGEAASAETGRPEGSAPASLNAAELSLAEQRRLAAADATIKGRP
jgi:catechol 2,3-dioxygenase-like lactoylglutathione lyase family enzyme